jgi:cell pole-organizing protein PopZ
LCSVSVFIDWLLTPKLFDWLDENLPGSGTRKKCLVERVLMPLKYWDTFSK